MFLSLLFSLSLIFAKEIQTNEVTIANAPEWLRQTQVEKITERVQQKLEWSIRRVNLRWYHSEEEFASAHSLGPMALAVTEHKGGRTTIHVGPKVDAKNFGAVLGHELVHVILHQKYKGAIPKWFEEGLANHLSKTDKVDYKWLAQKPLPSDVRELAHPFREKNAMEILFRYKASQALAEMLDKKCGLENLIRLSVERKMEDYIVTYCEIKDLNEAFKAWVADRSKTTT